jgi:hypothetical protein
MFGAAGVGKLHRFFGPKRVLRLARPERFHGTTLR